MLATATELIQLIRREEYRGAAVAPVAAARAPEEAALVVAAAAINSGEP